MKRDGSGERNRWPSDSHRSNKAESVITCAARTQIQIVRYGRYKAWSWLGRCPQILGRPVFSVQMNDIEIRRNVSEQRSRRQDQLDESLLRM